MEFQMDVLPAKPIRVVLYLTCLVQQNSSSGPTNQTFYSIRWAHSIVSVISPTETFLVNNVLEGVQRRLPIPTKKNPCCFHFLLLV
jgi:hypothetical protein